MRTSRADVALEAPYRASERLALAMPLIAALGLALVVSAAATGQSTLVVGLAALLGFGVCALAPLAAPSGATGDLVAVARDIRAGQESARLLGAALANWERTALAAAEAIVALRAQCAELAETKARSESQQLIAAQSQWVEIADALKSLSAAASDDGGLERIEQMLVYLADALERRDGDGLERVERALADIGRETRGVRDDIALTTAENKAVERRQSERMAALEAGVLHEIAAAERRRPAPEPLGEVVSREKAGWLERWREQTSQLDRIESHVARKVGEGEAKSLATLSRVTDRLHNAIDRLDTLSAAAATPNDEMKAALRSDIVAAVAQSLDERRQLLSGADPTPHSP